uniref:Uncharacterized protein n=1 Tax=Caenorhabditis japonica TaxID=281687 RepID=A0A8R1DWC8_CAEJA
MPISTISVHDITPDVISNVSFALLANSSNIYPIKIGTLLCEATRQNLTLKLTVESTTPISFYFSKCGFKITHLPVTTDNTVYLDYKQVRFLKMLQNEQCQKPWMNNIMELELKADTFDAEGSIRFEVVNMVKEQENFDIFVIRVTLIALVISAIICCAIISNHNSQFPPFWKQPTDVQENEKYKQQEKRKTRKELREEDAFLDEIIAANRKVQEISVKGATAKVKEKTEGLEPPENDAQVESASLDEKHVTESSGNPQAANYFPQIFHGMKKFLEMLKHDTGKVYREEELEALPKFYKDVLRARDQCRATGDPQQKTIIDKFIQQRHEQLKLSSNQGDPIRTALYVAIQNHNEPCIHPTVMYLLLAREEILEKLESDYIAMLCTLARIQEHDSQA